jgi:gluconate 5-dehydrogenase
VRLFSLAGKRALITGGTKGIGLAIGLALAEAGAEIVVSGRTDAGLAAASQKFADAGFASSGLRLDVADAQSIDATFDLFAQKFGVLDVLVNNAGVEEVRAAADVDAALWDRIVGTNLKGAFFCAQAAARLMPAGGAILNICSLASEVGIPCAAPYGASKSGLAGMTRALAAEWAPRGIRVNGIGPGYFRTDMTEVFYADAGWRETMLPKIPMRRFGALEDLAGSAIFLCSPASAYITGQVVYVDGGYLASI